MTEDGEKLVWSGGPSQWVNAPLFAFCALLAGVLVIAGLAVLQPLVSALAAIPVLMAIWKWLEVKCTDIELTTERIKTYAGVLSRRKHELELYRVKDTYLNQPFLLRILGLGNVEIVSSDRTTPTLTLRAIRDAEAVREQVRTHVEQLRIKRRVREVDFE